ncbi:MAG: hypothetical protein IKL38_08480 [Firmicutes bacterium]|nr:hypothetical protein [Bacillota bacterium]
MLKRSVCWLLVLMTLLTALVGCGSGDEQADEQSSMLTEDNRQESSMVKQEEEVSQLTQTPAVGGEFKLAIENPTSLLPWQVTDEATGNLLMLIYSPLMEQKEDGTMLPCLAASKSWSADLSELTIKLRSDVTFHNGKQLTAQDVVYSIQMLQSSQNVYSDVVKRIALAEATEEGDLLLRFSAPGRMNEEGLIFPIVPEEYSEALVPMGTGPYAFSKMETMRELQLVRYEDYFGMRPYIADVKVYFVRDIAAVEQCFETSRTNLMQTDYFAWGSYINQKNLTTHPFDSYEAVYLEFNTAGTFGMAYSNREKVALAVDAVRVLRDSYWGKGTITETLLRPGSWYKDEPTKNFGYDAEKAASIVAVGSGTVRLLYDAEDPILSAAAETVKMQLEASGLKVQLKTAGGYDIALRRDRMTLMKAAQVVGKQNLLANAENEDDIRAAAKQLDEYMNEELTVYNLFFLTQATVTGYGIKGEMKPGDWNVYSGIEELYMQTEEELVADEAAEKGGAVQ